MKLGFVLSNYKAKLQIEIRVLNKKLESKNIFKVFTNHKLKRQLIEKEELYNYVNSYIKYLEKSDVAKLETNVLFNKKLKNIVKISELKEMLDNI